MVDTTPVADGQTPIFDDLARSFPDLQIGGTRPRANSDGGSISRHADGHAAEDPTE